MNHSKTFEDLLGHQAAFNERLNLVASENSLGMNARLAFLTDVINRYYFPLPEYRFWAFPGNEYIEKIYERCKEKIKNLTGASYVNIHPISGINAMTVALAALCEPGQTIATLSPENGGHSITHFLAKRLGIETVFIPYDQKKFRVRADALAETVRKKSVSLVYLDQAHILFPLNLEGMKSVLPDTVKIYYDGSHVMGLIFGKQFQDPLKEGALFLGGNTHKTIPGPHKAFITTDSPKEAQKIEQLSKMFISHDHPADVAALTIVFEEMEGKWEEYARRVVKNAQHLAFCLDQKGFRVLAKEHGFTRSHQLWIDTEPYAEAYEAVMILARCNVMTNTIQAPSVLERLSLRIGIQEATYLGADEAAMGSIADVFEKALIKKLPEEKIKDEVREIKKLLRPVFDKMTLERILAVLA